MYDLVIGNPPYGKYGGKYDGMGEGKIHKKLMTLLIIFISRGLDLLRPNGLLIYVIGFCC